MKKVGAPSLCAHKKNRKEGNKQICLRCERVRIEEKDRICFYWNGEHYFTLEKNGRRNKKD